MNLGLVKNRNKTGCPKGTLGKLPDLTDKSLPIRQLDRRRIVELGLKFSILHATLRTDHHRTVHITHDLCTLNDAKSISPGLPVFMCVAVSLCNDRTYRRFAFLAWFLLNIC